MSVAAIGRGTFANAAFSANNILRQWTQIPTFSLRNLFNPSQPRLLPTLAIGLSLNLPPSLSSFLDGLLKAVPKKKQSHSRKRMRQLAGKALEDNIALNTCPGCGGVKRSHHLCPDCVQDIREMWKATDAGDKQQIPSSEPEQPALPETTPTENTRGSGNQPSI